MYCADSEVEGGARGKRVGVGGRRRDGEIDRMGIEGTRDKEHGEERRKGRLGHERKREQKVRRGTKARRK